MSNINNLGIKSNLDKFYTKPEVAAQCIKYASTYFSCVNTFLEPSAGDGSFLNLLTPYKKTIIALDIAPENTAITKADFLSWHPDNTHQTIMTIGNPPFGKRMAAAVAFFNHAATFSDYICFILPVTFMKWSVQKQLDKNFKLLEYYYLPDNSFLNNGKEYNIRCVFQIWSKHGTKDLRLTKNPPTSIPEFNLWQYNATPQALPSVEENWKYALYRQGRYDYNQIFTREDYSRIKEEMTRSKHKRQFFFVEPLTAEAEKNFLQMDFNALADRNAITPGFGKSDFVGYYLELFK